MKFTRELALLILSLLFHATVRLSQELCPVLLDAAPVSAQAVTHAVGVTQLCRHCMDLMCCLDHFPAFIRCCVVPAPSFSMSNANTEHAGSLSCTLSHCTFPAFLSPFSNVCIFSICHLAFGIGFLSRLSLLVIPSISNFLIETYFRSPSAINLTSLTVNFLFKLPITKV